MSKQENQRKQAAGKRATYTREFRDEAVRLTVTSGKSVAQVARDLGVSEPTLHEWRRHARYAHRLPVAENESVEQQIKRLQKELELVQQERDILKKPLPILPNLQRNRHCGSRSAGYSSSCSTGGAV